VPEAFVQILKPKKSAFFVHFASFSRKAKNMKSSTGSSHRTTINNDFVKTPIKKARRMAGFFVV